ncbi:hypothetical protein SAMN05421767_1587 [Granulicatella balaenopterae]|uniref:Uncharacterized protein n=1 Tax=Granulicatella balaenopterae TaxID=137733 RepID=A0A1H9PHJ6_9LACT|nr:hypothetical protein [Granulicatella balaenopterae]SER47329.1 hypothetical protein SAMN05421767_1587 [Granulicatella balaenopterae]
MGKKIFTNFLANYKYKGFTDDGQIVNVSNRFNKLLGSHVSADENNVVVRVGSNHIRKTKYGYLLIVDAHHVVFFKDWQNWGHPKRCNSFIINFNREFYKVKEYGDFSEFFSDEPSEELSSFDGLIKLAREQEAYYNNPENEATFNFRSDFTPKM